MKFANSILNVIQLFRIFHIATTLFINTDRATALSLKNLCIFVSNLRDYVCIVSLLVITNSVEVINKKLLRYTNSLLSQSMPINN